MIVGYFPHDVNLLKIRDLENQLIALGNRLTDDITNAVTALNTRIDGTNTNLNNLIKKHNDEVTAINTRITTVVDGLSTNHRHNASYINLDASHRFVTDAQITNWNSKAAGNHTHDGRYYTEAEMNTKLNGKANSSHTHDDRYYTETEINTKINTINTNVGRCLTKAVHVGTSAPTNTNMLWLNTGNEILYYYNSGWKKCGGVWK